MAFIQPLELVKFPTLLIKGNSLWPCQIQNRLSRTSQEGALIGGGKITAVPDLCSIDRCPPRVLNHDKTRHFLIFGAQSVRDPTSNGGTPRKLASRRYMKRRGAMVGIVRFDPVDEGEPVGVSGEIWKQLRKIPA